MLKPSEEKMSGYEGKEDGAFLILLKAGTKRNLQEVTFMLLM